MAATGDLPLAISALPAGQNLNSCYDTNEMDAYINFEPIYPSPSLSPSTDAKPMNPSPSSQSYQHSHTTSSSPALNATPYGSNTQVAQQVSFSAPSHQYASYQQQTGLPMGGLANTIALNPSPGLNMGFNGSTFGTTEGFGVMNRPSDLFSVSPNDMPPFLVDSADLDAEADNARLSQGAMLASQPSKSQFIDPNAMGGQELSPVAPPQPIGRVYPGIHQQQAARARAAQQQRQQEMLRRQQQQQQQQQQHQLAQGQPQPQAGHVRHASRSQQKVNRPVDPLVEERISRLLQQMRQGSMSFRDDQQPVPNALPQPTRQRKDEQDMDEDERLLASEEGKKLSSKERRQLRNKVSARAFRSRRKEYIGQLEGELTAKTNETNDLRLQNRALMEENSRLADLTRMLLSSPHFSSFLNDLSVNGPPAQLLQPPSTQPPAPAEIANDSKAAQVAQDVQLSNPQTVLPPLVEDEFDFASFESGFNSGIDPNFSNPTILAVMEVPEGPSIDTAALSGKSSFSTGSVTSDLPKELCPSFSHSLIQITPLESSSQETCGFQTADVDENDPSFTLYLDQPKEEPNSPFANVCSGPPSEKVTARFDLVVDADAAGPNRVDLIALRQFQRFRASIESSYERVCRATSHLG